MKTNVELNLDILNEYTDFEKVNSNWNILSYLNYKYDTNCAVAFSKFFFPDFIEFKGGIFIGFLFNEKNVSQWFDEFGNDISSVEKMANLYEIKDFFHINDNENPEIIEEFAKVLIRVWSLNLKELFPKINFQVKVFEEYDSSFITFYRTIE